MRVNDREIRHDFSRHAGTARRTRKRDRLSRIGHRSPQTNLSQSYNSPSCTDKSPAGPTSPTSRVFWSSTCFVKAARHVRHVLPVLQHKPGANDRLLPFAIQPTRAAHVTASLAGSYITLTDVTYSERKLQMTEVSPEPVRPIRDPSNQVSRSFARHSVARRLLHQGRLSTRDPAHRTGFSVHFRR